MRSAKIILYLVSLAGTCAQTQRSSILIISDANVNLRGTIEGKRFHGKWSFDGYAGAISKGTFEATRK